MRNLSDILPLGPAAHDAAGRATCQNNDLLQHAVADGHNGCSLGGGKILTASFRITVYIHTVYRREYSNTLIY